MLPEDFQDFRPLVPDLDVCVVQEPVESGRRRLRGKLVAVNGAEQKGAQGVSAAEEEHVAGVGQLAGQVLHFFEMTEKPLLQLWQRHVRNVAAVKVFERKTELGSELVEGQFRHARLPENRIVRPPYRRQVVHQRPGPIEDHVANHPWSVVRARGAATHKRHQGCQRAHLGTASAWLEQVFSLSSLRGGGPGRGRAFRSTPLP